jgi:hypothetical protein
MRERRMIEGVLSLVVGFVLIGIGFFVGTNVKMFKEINFVQKYLPGKDAEEYLELYDKMIANYKKDIIENASKK